MSIGNAVNEFLFGIYPYIALVVLLLGSVVRFDREPYTWKSDSSQLLRRHQMRLGSNLFHYGILVVIIGHFVGFLTPEWAIGWAISPAQHALMAMLAGGIAGLVAIVGISILIHRRVTDPRVRNNSRKWDLAVVLLLWLQLALGLLTVPFSAQHMGGAMFEVLVTYVQGIVTFHGGVASLLLGTPVIYRIHIFVGFTIFLISPFTRMIHIWSGVGSLAYLFRPYQLVRTRRRTS
ncbi:MAG: respiratory nitrate reductase subunit gamma [Acetobacteraceae bacterium]